MAKKSESVNNVPHTPEEPDPSLLYDEIDQDDGGAYRPQPLRIRWGGGGIRTFVDASTGEAIKELIGVIPASRVSRAYWSQGFAETGGGTPPDCYSNDGITGSSPDVNPNLACETCQYNEFGSDGRRGKACKELRRLIMITTDGLPYLISVPPSSLRFWDQYCTALRGRGLRYYAVTTKLGLDKAQNKDGIEYAQLTTELVNILSYSKIKEIAELRKQFVKALVGPATVAELTEGAPEYMDAPPDDENVPF